MIADKSGPGFRMSRWSHDYDLDKTWVGFSHSRRGDIRPIIMNLLLERPMHGYELIRLIEEKSQGMWRPSPGTIYPLMQLLEETDVVMAREEDGKKIYSLTKTGKEEAKQIRPKDLWKSFDKKNIDKIIELKKAKVKAIYLLHDIGRSGDKDKMNKAIAILKNTSERLVELIDSDQTKLNGKKGNK